ncbi:MAG: hypothetical protein KF843_11925 [Flavobacteriales bacterium]|nr:hypothetical protein [Flavobacteriales bacterium]
MLGDLEKLLVSIRGQQSMIEKLSGTQLPFHIARSFGNQILENNIARMMTGGMSGMMGAMNFAQSFQKQLLDQQSAWTGISGSLNHLVAAKAISEDLGRSAFLSQLGLQNSLKTLAEQYTTPLYNPFSVLNAAFLGISDRAYRRLSVDHSQDEVEELNQIVQGLEAIAAEQAGLDRPVTIRDLEKFKAEVVDALVAAVSRSKTAIAIEVILALITFISFALQLREMSWTKSDITNREVLEQTKLYAESLVLAASTVQVSGRDFRWNTRIANHNVRLRSKTSTHSEVLALIEEGQQVVVITVKKKWLYISYVENATGEPRSGYAYKKYFDRE